MGKFRKIFQDEVERHRAELDKQQPRDYIDYYIVEQDKDTCFTGTVIGKVLFLFIRKYFKENQSTPPHRHTVYRLRTVQTLQTNWQPEMRWPFFRRALRRFA